MRSSIFVSVAAFAAAAVAQDSVSQFTSHCQTHN